MTEASILPPNASAATARAIARLAADATFCGFTIEGERKRPQSLTGAGVSGATPKEALLTSVSVLTDKTPPGTHWGVSMHAPTEQRGMLLVCLDLDAKRSSAPPDIRIKRLVEAAKASGMLYERSVSMKGAHIWLCAPRDATLPPKIDVGPGQQIEIFGMPKSTRVSVMLTGIEQSGELKGIPSLRDFLVQAGVDPDIKTEPQAPRPQTTHEKVAASQVREMLAHIVNADLDYDDWLRICMAAKTAGGDHEDIIQWSRTSRKHDDAEFSYKWGSWTDKPDGVGLGTLRKIAYDSGWEPPADYSGLGTPTEPAPDHPLAIEVGLSDRLVPPRMVIPGFVSEGIVSFAGQHGIGKTTGILPLAFIAAGLIQGELTPRHWRHVIYVTEDTGQAQRIISGLAASIGLDYDTIAQRFHLVEAVRMHASKVVQVAQTYSERYTRFEPHYSNGTLVELKPLVVFDTKSAVFSMENENDAAEAAEMMATLKQRFNKFPVWIIGHIAKASFGKSDALSARGSTAIEADAHQNAYIVAEGDRRYIILGKRRFEAKWTEIELVSEVSESVGIDEYGQAEPISIRWSVPQPPIVTRQEAAQAAREEAQGESDTDRRTAILEAVEDAWMAGNPTSRTKVKDSVRGKAAAITQTTEVLIREGWLYEVEVPPKRRINNNKRAFLVRLTDAERRQYMETGTIPATKSRIFPTWATGSIPSVPDTIEEGPENDEIEW